VTAKLTPKQIEANRLLGGPARNIMLRGGSRSGKTFLLVRAIIQRAINAPGSRHAIFRFRFNHAKTSLWADTIPKVLNLCFPTLRVNFNKTDFYIELPNGSQMWIGGLDDKERVEKILGSEYSTLYFNESSQIPWSSIETAMSRLAQKVELAPEIAKFTGRTHLTLKAYFDLNPPSKLHWSYQLFRAGVKPGTKETLPNPDDYAEMRVNPSDNVENLPSEYFDVLSSMSAARRLRFEAGEWASEIQGALWSVEDRQAGDGKIMPGLDTLRVAEAPEMQRIVVAIDPSGTRGDGGGDDIGIVVAGLGVDGHGYVLADETCNMSPEGWGRRAVDLYHHWGADRIVAERNYGGDMVRSTIATVDKNAAYKEVVASRGKAVRAEPVSALYEQSRMHHVGHFPDLEDQMCLAAGTLIETDRGFVRIEEINTQDRVLTRKGFAPVKWAGYTGSSSEFIEIGTDGCLIRTTQSHPIFDSGSGKFVNAEFVRHSHTLLVSRRWASMVNRSRGEAVGITGCLAGITGTRKGSCCTERFTRHITGRLLKAWMFITSTEILGATFLKISNHFRGKNTPRCTSQEVSQPSVMSRSSGLAWCAAVGRKLLNSSRRIIVRTAATCGNIGVMLRQNPSSRLSAQNVEKKESQRENENSVHTDVKQITTLRHTRSVNEPVYNISVADGFPPEFFANGILVHNCNFTASGYVGENSPDRADAMVWAITELMLNEQLTVAMFLKKRR
jgi:hypothetical protein